MAAHLSPEEKDAACAKCSKLRALSRDKDNLNEAKTARAAFMRTLRKNGLAEADIDAYEKRNKAPEQVPFVFSTPIHAQDWRRCIVSTVVTFFGGFAMHGEGSPKVVMLGPTDDMMRAGRAAISVIRQCEQDVSATFMSVFEFDTGERLSGMAAFHNSKVYWSTLPAERGPYAYLGLLIAELIIDEIERIQRLAAATAKGPWTPPPASMGPASGARPSAPPPGPTAIASRAKSFRGASTVQGWEQALTGEAASAPPPEVGFPQYHIPSWVISTFQRLAARVVADYLTNDGPAPAYVTGPVASAVDKPKPPTPPWPFQSTGGQQGAPPNPAAPTRANGSPLPEGVPAWALESSDAYALWLDQQSRAVRGRPPSGFRGY